MPLRKCNPRISLTCSARNRAPPQATPYTVSALPSAAVQIAAGYDSSYAMLVDGSVWAWGYNRYGQLGDGTTAHRLSPVRIEGYGADTAMRLPSGGVMAQHMLVVTANGTAMGSGENVYGQLGNIGGNRFPDIPSLNLRQQAATDWSVHTAGALPQLGGGIVQVARGSQHTLVLKGG